eukprot:364326-Chlamydomonas_euryale.AAC.21
MLDGDKLLKEMATETEPSTRAKVTRAVMLCCFDLDSAHALVHATIQASMRPCAMRPCIFATVQASMRPCARASSNPPT